MHDPEGGAALPARPEDRARAANLMSLDPLLLNLLACPIDKQALLYLAEYDVLYNPRLRRSYRSATAYRSCWPTRARR